MILVQSSQTATPKKLAPFARLKGFVLITVLAILTLISLLVVTVNVNTSSVTKEFIHLNSRSDRYNLVNSAVALAAAKRLARDPENPSVEGSVQANLINGEIQVDYRNLAGKVSLSGKVALLVGALGAAGETPESAQRLARIIFDWNDTDDIIRGTSGDKENPGLTDIEYPNKQMQTALELGQIPEFSQDLIARLQPFVSAYTGVNSVHPLLVQPAILAHIEGVSPVNASILKQKSFYDDEVERIIQEENVLQGDVILQESPSWELAVTITPKHGRSERFDVVIATLGSVSDLNDTQPYRVLDFVGSLERIN